MCNNFILSKIPNKYLNCNINVYYLKKILFSFFSLCFDDSSKGNLKIPLINQLTFLGQTFSRLVDGTLGFLVQRVVDCLDVGCSPAMVHAAISSIISMGLDGEHMCFIVARVTNSSGFVVGWIFLMFFSGLADSKC